MRAFIYFKKCHSDKKDKDYFSSVINLGGVEKFINLDYETMSILENKSIREILELPVGFKSKEFELKIDD